MMFAVLRTVDLDDELLLRAGEVDDVAGNRELPAKAGIHQAMPTQLIPKHQLDVGHRLSHATRVAAVCRWDVIVYHAAHLRRNGNVGALRSPPSVLPDISPSRGE